MKIQLFSVVICALFLLHAAGHVESARSISRRGGDDDRPDPPPYKLFVFGDTFVDNGNTDKDDDLTQWTRSWYSPYGISDSKHDGKPTGRYSDAKLQSDMLAMIMGHEESPPPENLRQDNGVDPFGANFAVGFATVVTGRLYYPPNLDMQISGLRKLLRHGHIDRISANQSVALIAFSGYDYYNIPDQDAHPHRFVRFIDDVTDAIVDGVSDLRQLGINKVLVNNLHPMGCTPRYTRATTNYTRCIKDNVTDIHNRMLKDKLDDSSSESILLLDLHDAFTSLIHRQGTGFVHWHVPCCESYDEDGYCGQVNSDGVQQFRLCDRPDKYFYFDDWHPTQAGWKAVMDQLEGTIKDFLNIDF